MNAIATPVQSGWSATLELEFDKREQRTVLVRNRHNGPLRVQRPFYPEPGGQAHAYILHPPGGIVAGDSLSIAVNVHGGAHALLTTPSAGRVYKSNSQRLLQSQHVNITVQPGAVGEWLPQENIVFDRAQALNKTHINLHPNARFIGWEVTCLGRPAAQETFNSGVLMQSFTISQEHTPLLIERNRIEGGSDILHSRWGLSGHTAFGTLVCTLDDIGAVKTIQKLCQQHRSDHLIIEQTQLPQLLVIRAHAMQAEPIKNAFIDLWRQIRLLMLKADAIAPRIWFT
jgi:urease accessory protein